MLAGILFLALVLVVAVLITVDVLKTPVESLPEQADRSAHETHQATIRARRAPGSRALPPEPAGSSITAYTHDADRGRGLDGISSSASGHRRPGTWSAAQHRGLRGAPKNWPVRSRLSLLVIISVAAATVVTLSVARIADSLQSVSMHSHVSSVHDGAVVSAFVAGLILIVVLALAVWLLIIVARSVLQPLHRLQAGALEVADERLP